MWAANTLSSSKPQMDQSGFPTSVGYAGVTDMLTQRNRTPVQRELVSCIPGFGNFTFAPNGALWAASGPGVFRFKDVDRYKVDEPLNTG